MEQVIEFESAERLRDFSSVFSSINESYVFSRIRGGEATRLPVDERPLKMSGTMLMLVLSGSDFEIELNLQPYTVSAGSLLGVFPGTVARLAERLPADIDAFCLFFDTKFLQGVNLNMSAIMLPPVLKRPSPVLNLTEREADTLTRYFDLLHINSTDAANPQISKSIASSLLAAMFYQIVQCHHSRIDGMVIGQSEQTGTAGCRRHDYVREFLKLVQLHHVNERSVSFYAGKLYISAKYLTLLVKEATGRSAAKWIDDFVIMEAKNLLRFSGKNIQQVAYALNFSTQSSFGKYFKHLTGMSPTEFQKS